MNNLKQMITSIDLDHLLKIFDMQIAIAVLLFFIFFRTVFARMIIKIYYRITKCKKNPKESSMYKPLRTFFILMGIFCAANILPLSKQISYIINNIFKIVIIFYCTRALTALITEDSAFFKKFFKKSENKALDRFVCKGIRGFFWVIFVFIALNELGYDLTKFNGLIAGLGIGSAAIALAAQELVKNILSGATILTDKPFIIGDWIEVGTYQGTVIDITFRSTRIKSLDNTVITIPNSTITSTYVINWNRLNSRRFECVLNLNLNTPTEKVRKIIKETKLVLANNPKVIKETINVSLDAITAYSTNIKIFLYVTESDYIKYLKCKEDILCSLLFLAEKENIELAYPTQTLYVKGKGALGE